MTRRERERAGIPPISGAGPGRLETYRKLLRPEEYPSWWQRFTAWLSSPRLKVVVQQGFSRQETK